MAGLTSHSPLAYSRHPATPQKSPPQAEVNTPDSPQNASIVPAVHQQESLWSLQNAKRQYKSNHHRKQALSPYSSQPIYTSQEFFRNGKSHKNTCIRLESCLIAANSALFITGAALIGVTLGTVAPILAPLMGVQVALIGLSAGRIARKKKARKYGF